jgi:hypothetical protein
MDGVGVAGAVVGAPGGTPPGGTMIAPGGGTATVVRGANGWKIGREKKELPDP